MPPPRRLLIAWWSNTGGTEQLVGAAADGAAAAAAALERTDGFDVLACRCDRLSPRAVCAADALLFASPECLGTVAGPMKAFLDRCYYPVLEHLAGRPYAVLVCAGSDGHGAIRQLDRIATGWRLRRVAEPCLVVTGAQSAQAIAAPKTIAAADLGRARALGETLGGGTALGLW
jgi:multimeric flavodoxin WrbA